MDLLDRLHSYAAVAAFSPASYGEQLAHDIGEARTLAELEQRDARLAQALLEIDETASRIMRIRLEHEADAMPAPARRVFASTIATYAGKLDLLEDRVRQMRASDAVVDAVVTAARETLAVRTELRASALALIQELAAAGIPIADQHARDRELEDAPRKKWSRVRRDLEVLAAHPDRIQVAPMAVRIGAWPEQLDEPAAPPELSFAELIELD